MNYFALSLTSLLLGVVHGFDTDHVVDVTDFVSQDPRPLQAAMFGARFGIGHTATVLTLGLAVYVLKSAVPAFLEGAFQLLSGIALILLGLWSINRRLFRQGGILRRREHCGKEAHAAEKWALDNTVFQYGPLVTGVMTGMVGTAGVMLLGPVTAAPSAWWAAFFILTYGMGVIGAMCGYGFVASKLFGVGFGKGCKGSFFKIISALPGIFSITLGSVWFYRIAIGFKEVIGAIK